MAHLDDLKSVIVENLEKRGVLNTLQGKIRSEIFNALDDKAAVKPKPTNDTILINELIREYLEYNNYKYAAMTLTAETGQGDSGFSRDFIESELGVKSTQQARKVPLLYTLVHSFTEQRNTEQRRAGGEEPDMTNYTRADSPYRLHSSIDSRDDLH